MTQPGPASVFVYSLLSIDDSLAKQRSNGRTGIATNRGGSKAYSTAYDTASIAILPATNHASTLNPAGDPKLTSFTNGGANNGTRITTLIASMGPSGSITDSDAGAKRGIAIIGVNNTAGTWQYTIHNGAHWQAVGSTAINSARLLAADANTRLRFVPTSTTFKYGGNHLHRLGSNLGNQRFPRRRHL